MARLERGAAPGGVQMTRTLRIGLVADGVPAAIVDALATAMLNAGVDRTAQVYANAMDDAFRDYQVHGVKTQVLYMLLNMSRWQGEQAKTAKKLLKKWSGSQ